MVQEITPRGSVFGRLGKSLGEGIEKSLPREAERGRLSSGLQKLGLPSELAGLYGLPGGKEIAPYVTDYLSSQREGSLYDQPESQQPRISEAEELHPVREKPITGIPKYDRNASNYLTPTDPQLLGQKAEALRKEKGISFTRAKQFLEDQDAKRIQAEQAFESRATMGKNLFDEDLTLLLQKEGQGKYADLEGLQQKKYQTLVDQDISAGISPKQAANTRAKEAFEFAKARQKVKNIGSEKWFSGGTRSAKKAALMEDRKQYKKADALETFKNDLITYQGLTSPAASYLAFPPQENSELQSAIKASISDKKVGTGILDDKKVSNIVSKIRPDDSLQAIAFEIQNKGASGASFMERVAKLAEQGKVKLSPEQEAELGSVPDFKKNLSDVYFFSFGGLE